MALASNADAMSWEVGKIYYAPQEFYYSNGYPQSCASFGIFRVNTLTTTKFGQIIMDVSTDLAEQEFIIESYVPSQTYDTIRIKENTKDVNIRERRRLCTVNAWSVARTVVRSGPFAVAGSVGGCVAGAALRDEPVNVNMNPFGGSDSIRKTVTEPDPQNIKNMAGAAMSGGLGGL
eukprot:868763_1